MVSSTFKTSRDSHHIPPIPQALAHLWILLSYRGVPVRVQQTKHDMCHFATLVKGTVSPEQYEACPGTHHALTIACETFDGYAIARQLMVAIFSHSPL